MKIFYMNQGGAKTNVWGGISYSNYDILLLAESDQEKKDFSLDWYSKDSTPVMSVQTSANHRTRVIENIEDVDGTSRHVRPLVRFHIKGTNIRVYFFHLKSASEKAASEALKTAVEAEKADIKLGGNRKVLWIGDFNRADDEVLQELRPCDLLIAAGGVSKWPLDRVYATGSWGKGEVTAGKITQSTDNAHAGVAVELNI